MSYYNKLLAELIAFDGAASAVKQLIAVGVSQHTARKIVQKSYRRNIGGLLGPLIEQAVQLRRAQSKDFSS